MTRITPEKGIHTLIEATAKLKTSPAVQLLVVGGPYFPKDVEYMDTLKVQAEKLGVSDRVIFTGFLEDTGAILSLLDIVLLASTIPEACPRTIIEAMAAGVPVIATPLGGSKELVTPETGLLVPAEDADAFAGSDCPTCRGCRVAKTDGEGVPFAGGTTVLCDAERTVDGGSLFGLVVNMGSCLNYHLPSCIIIV